MTGEARPGRPRSVAIGQGWAGPALPRLAWRAPELLPGTEPETSRWALPAACPAAPVCHSGRGGLLPDGISGQDVQF